MLDFLNKIIPNVMHSTDRLLDSILATLQMTLWSGVVMFVCGLFLGVVLTVTREGGIMQRKALYQVLDKLINVCRSIPFVIFIAILLPVTKAIMGTKIGVRGVIVPLVAASVPFFARQVESALAHVEHGLIEAAESMGSTTWQIIRKVLIPEAMPSLINGAALCMTTVLAYTAMAGSAGGDGLGKIAITYGLNYREYDIMYVSSLLLVALVQIIQIGGDILMRAVDHRKK